ncbi:MAG: thioesterase [Chloroflexi bacterium]|nr:MAG: thioesterase [Chloroflexota bacterium]
MAGVWVRRQRRDRPARVTLFCLPFAGGGAGAFREWPDLLPDDVEVCPVHLPGREARFAEPPIDDVGALVGPLLLGLTPHLDGPFALYGHSMGGLIAFELADRLRRRGVAPAWFFASGVRGPHRPRRAEPRHGLPDDQFLAAVRQLNGTPPELLANPEILELLLPMLRSDFRLAETYRYLPRPPLDCPVVAFGGRDDPDVSVEDLEAWRQQAAGHFEVHVLPGDHFFLGSARADLLRIIGERLAGV